MTTPDTTVVESDGSWIGRTIVALVVIALLVLGAVWLFNNVGDGGGGGTDDPVIENNVDPGGDGDTDGDTGGNTDPIPQPS